MTNEKIEALWQGVNALAQKDVGVKLAFALAKNRSKLRTFMKALDESRRPAEGFEDGIRDLQRDMATKRDDGSPVGMPNGQLVIADQVKFLERVEELKAATGQDKREEEVAALMKDESEIDLHLVAADTLPAEIRPDVLETLLPMIDGGPS